jgi:hypothetical protein
MQHPLTTYLETVVTPKKSADARAFCFPQRAWHSRLAPRWEIERAVGYRLCPEGAETGLILKCDGGRHEEMGFVSNGAGNGIGFCFRG